MKTIEYAHDGEAIGDYQAAQRAEDFLKSNLNYIKVGSEVFINAVRVLIHNRRFPYRKVQFIFQGIEINSDSSGRLESWPAGFCDVCDKILGELLSPQPSCVNNL